LVFGAELNAEGWTSHTQVCTKTFRIGIVLSNPFALDETGKPSFNALQNYGSSEAALVYYVFDVPIRSGRDLPEERLKVRRELLESQVLPHLSDPIRPSRPLTGGLDELIHAVRVHGLEGLVAKRRDSPYESGERSGAWSKMRVNAGQEFVIGGYTVGGRTFDALVFGIYAGPLCSTSRARATACGIHASSRWAKTRWRRM
jgi:bifunctional non-homologous end joining protein LigD